jgi:hypothetical protein
MGAATAAAAPNICMPGPNRQKVLERTSGKWAPQRSRRQSNTCARRSDDTDARREARRCVGRSDRRAQGWGCKRSPTAPRKRCYSVTSRNTDECARPVNPPCSPCSDRGMAERGEPWAAWGNRSQTRGVLEADVGPSGSAPSSHPVSACDVERRDEKIGGRVRFHGNRFLVTDQSQWNGHVGYLLSLEQSMGSGTVEKTGLAGHYDTGLTGCSRSQP